MTQIDVMLKPTDFVAKAGTLITQAQEAEQRNTLPLALSYYEQALSILRNILQNKQNTFLREKINSYAADCLSKAEYIKELIESGASLQDNELEKRQLTTSPNEEKSKMMCDLALCRIDPLQLKVSWDDICGMESVKKILDEAIQMPLDMPQLFVGNRSPIQSVLFYGPPGTGKTLLGKAVACSSKIPFYSISSAEIVSKFVGESEKYVKSLFEMLKQDKPCVLFLDEIEALCARREETNQIKTVQQFLIQLDGISTTGSMEGIFLIGCTNYPWNLDEAMIRRLEKRIYIALPECDERERSLHFYLAKNEHTLTDEEIREVALATCYFSQADIKQLIKTAAMIPLSTIREAKYFEMLKDGSLRPCDTFCIQGMPMTYAQIVDKEMVRVPPITASMVNEALLSVKSTVDIDTLKKYKAWTEKYGQ